MKRALISTVLFAAVVLIGGCGSSPPSVNYYRLAAGDRVGILVDIGDTVFYTRVQGTGDKVLQRDARLKSYSGDWGLRTHMARRLAEELRTKGGLQAVDLADHGIAYYRIAGLVGRGDGGWVVRPSRRAVYDRLVRELRLKAVVVVTERQILATYKCTAQGCRNYYSPGQGLVRVQGDYGDTYLSAAAYEADVFTLDPPDNLGLQPVFKSLEERRVRRLRRFALPRDERKISQQVLAPLAVHLRFYLDRLAGQIADTLRPY